MLCEKAGEHSDLESSHGAIPRQTSAVGASMSGLDYLQAIVDRRLPPPPMGQVMRFEFLAVEPGRVVFACELDDPAYNPIGVVHGGLVCTVLDSVAGSALHSTLPAGKGYTSVEIKVNYLRAVPLSSGLCRRCRSRSGRRRCRWCRRPWSAYGRRR